DDGLCERSLDVQSARLSDRQKQWSGIFDLVQFGRKRCTDHIGHYQDDAQHDRGEHRTVTPPIALWLAPYIASVLGLKRHHRCPSPTALRPIGGPSQLARESPARMEHGIPTSGTSMPQKN